tara:strand:+ start:918 stop:1763 length:846 start_codon:yes stop_codon:yes gene_type:complete
MSEVTQPVAEEDKKANPYNMSKPWHTPDSPHVDTAEQMFFEKPQQQATLTNDEAPDESQAAAPKKRTNYKKRYDDLKRHYDDKVNEFKQREQEMQAQTSPNYTTPKTHEDLEKFKREYPDLYDTVETVAHLQSSEQVNQLQGQLQAIQEREAKIVKREAEADLLANHPDFEDIRGSESFHEWAGVQPEQIQDWIYNNPDNAQLASKAIALYKIENGIQTQTKSQPKQRGSAADMVSTKTKTIDTKEPKIWSEREIAMMSLDQFDKYEEEIQQAISEGRVVK